MKDATELNFEDLLNARELRVVKQRHLINQFHTSLVSFMVNIPGKYKDTFLTRKIHDVGREILHTLFETNKSSILYEENSYLTTGSECLIVLDLDPIQLKKSLVEIENSHPLGRLFDFDVIDCNFNLITRESIDQPKRKCLLCDDIASVCARSQKHGYQELIDKITKLTTDYFNL